MALLQSRLFKPALLLPALLVWCSVCQAEVLYKWREADGTLTFSPNPPGDSNIQYEKVLSDQGFGGSLQAGTPPVPPATSNEKHQGQIAPGLTPNDAPIPATGNAIQRPLAEPALARSTQKKAHCQELQKRVVSLERLLQTDISNETMDNAVVQMARYQASFNQACNRLGLR